MNTSNEEIQNHRDLASRSSEHGASQLSRTVKRFLKVLAAVVGLASFSILFNLVIQHGQNWYDLPGNAKTRVFAVTQGTKHRLSFPTRSWNAHYRKVFSRSLSVSTLPSLFQREHGGSGAISDTPSTVIWFQSDTPDLVSFDATLVTADGQRYATQAANGASTDGYAYTGLQFQVVPPDPSLHLNATINGKNLDFEIPNPAFRKK